MTTQVLAAPVDVPIEGVIEEIREYHHAIPTDVDRPLPRPAAREHHGEPPTLSATPAGVAATRDARRPRGTTVHMNRVPEPPEDNFRSC
ncbi:hypothetical protein ACWDYH_12920 [Nocardia goodfellowii]